VTVLVCALSRVAELVRLRRPSRVVSLLGRHRPLHGGRLHRQLLALSGSQ
jgi:hypothetical protein